MKEYRKICINPWCKATFIFMESNINDGVEPETCNKCDSFNNELSEGVTWTEKEYEGSRDDGTPHQMNYKVRNFIE